MFRALDEGDLYKELVASVQKHCYRDDPEGNKGCSTNIKGVVRQTGERRAVMRIPSYADAFEALCLQAADEGRGAVLFGKSFERARKAARPFMVGEEFPSVYLEFPLTGEPFLDVVVILRKLSANTRIDSPAAEGTDALLEWASAECGVHGGVYCGFELDTKEAFLPAAAVHFQHFAHTELVAPFFEAIGEPERVQPYLDLAGRMPEGWPLVYLGLFRGRPDAPLRACGYLDSREQAACAKDPARIAAVFDAVGFTAYDNAMLARASELLEVAPGGADFQFDVLGDGRIGPTFALELQLDISLPDKVRASFANGSAARVLGLLEDGGAADGRWRLAGDAAFARAVDVELDGGKAGLFAFKLMPQWVKAGWTDRMLQPSKLYHLAKAGLMSPRKEA